MNVERALFAAYGWPEGIDDEGILALNPERSARIGAPVAQATRNHPVPPPG